MEAHAEPGSRGQAAFGNAAGVPGMCAAIWLGSSTYYPRGPCACVLYTQQANIRGRLRDRLQRERRVNGRCRRSRLLSSGHLDMQRIGDTGVRFARAMQ